LEYGKNLSHTQKGIDHERQKASTGEKDKNKDLWRK
jgi:hypothetical protein